MTEQLHFHFSLSCTGEGNGNPLQCSCLENPRDGVSQSRTRLKWLSSSSNSMVSAVALPKGVWSGCSPLKSQQTGQVGGKESLLYFRCRQLVGRADVCPKADTSHCDQRAVAVIDRIGGGWGWGLRVETAVSFDSHLETGHWWPDQHHLGCFRYSSFSAPGLVCFHLFEAGSRNCGSLSCGYSLVTMRLTFSTWGFRIYRTAHRIRLRILPIALDYA